MKSDTVTPIADGVGLEGKRGVGIEHNDSGFDDAERTRELYP